MMTNDVAHRRWTSAIDLVASTLTIVVALYTVTWLVRSQQTVSATPRPRVTAGLKKGMSVPQVSGVAYDKTPKLSYW